MKIVTARQMQAIDKYTIEEIGIEGVVLMENAGRQVVAKMIQYFPHLCQQKVNVVCGKGNNGGDGLVIARVLSALGVGVRIFLLAGLDSLSGDAGRNGRIAQKLNLPIYEIRSSGDLEKAKTVLSDADIIVDAIFGTGFIPPVRGIPGEVIELLNTAAKTIVSVDIPSGLGSDEARPSGPHLKAYLTVTFALPKPAHILPPACFATGKLEIADIGIPKEAIPNEDIRLELIEPSIFKSVWPSRGLESHKGTYGHLLILAGSPGKTGAAYLTSQAAARTGAGLVTLGIPESLNNIMEVKLTEVMTLPLPETEDKTFSIKARDLIAKHLPFISAIALGPGISTHHEAGELILWIMKEANIPMVLDADGINLLAGESNKLKECGRQIIITPHPRELSRLLGLDMNSILQDRVSAVKRAAMELDVYCVLKGYRSLISTPSGQVFVNPTGNPGMAAGGTGDVLTGIIGALLAQGFSKINALQMGVYIHGLLGDIVRKNKGECGILASDLIDLLPETIEDLKI